MARLSSFVAHEELAVEEEQQLVLFFGGKGNFASPANLSSVLEYLFVTGGILFLALT